MSHGGKRPGAGAPKGNKNRLRHGRYSHDDEAREAGLLLASLSPHARNKLRPLVRAGLASIKRRLSWVDPDLRQPDNVVQLRSATTPTQPVQSSPHLEALALRMTTLGYFGSRLFLQRHAGALDIIEEAVTYVEEQPNVISPAGLLRHLVHEELAELDGTVATCPYCRWRSGGREERTS